MYWIFLVIFIIAVMIPDIVRGPVSLLAEERAEEAAIFAMGVMALLVFIKNERLIIFHKKEKEKDQKKINQTVKDLVESYSYIGEVNRKMDILMNIALGFSEKSNLNKKSENEIYESIVSAANFLMKAEHTCLRFIDSKTKKTVRESQSPEASIPLKNKELTEMKENVNIKRCRDCFVISSPRSIENIRAYLIVRGYDSEEEKNPKNVEILKVFASQALFLFSYINRKGNVNCPDPGQKKMVGNMVK